MYNKWLCKIINGLSTKEIVFKSILSFKLFPILILENYIR